MRCRTLIIFIFIFSGCSSEPVKKGPDWIRGPSRVVDNGYIVYMGVSTAPSPDRAQFKAEGLALEDLANECSLIPRGTRLEDRYMEHEKYETTAYVKVALEFQECEEAKRSLDPQEIKKLANVNFTEQLKKYQDLVETGEMPPAGQVAEITPPDEVAPLPQSQQGWNASTNFYVARQYVVYQKEAVVLSPPTAYQPNSPETRVFVQTVPPVAAQVHTTEVANPAFRTQSWSSVPNREAIPRPGFVAARARPGYSPMRSVPARNFVPRGGAPPQKRGGGGYRRRRRRGEDNNF